MHIVYVIAPGGGPEAYVRTLAPALHARGHHVSIVSLVPAKDIKIPYPPSARVVYTTWPTLHSYLSKVIGGFRAFPLRLRAWEQAWAVYRALARIEREEPISLVEVTEGLPISLIRRRWPVVVRAHGSAATFRYFCHDREEDDRWLVNMEARQLREAHSIAALSQHLAGHLIEYYGALRERVHVLPYPIDTVRFQPEGYSPASDGTPRLLTIGRLERRKGTDTLLRSLSLDIWPRLPNTTACFLGNESDLKKADLLEMAPPDKRSQLLFPGFVDHRLLANYYDEATLYVAPTRYETFGYTVLEAMACGKPVVSTCVGAIPELVEDGVTGLLVPPDDSKALADAVCSLLGDGERRMRMGNRAREKAVAEFGLEKNVQETLDYYNCVIT